MPKLRIVDDNDGVIYSMDDRLVSSLVSEWMDHNDTGFSDMVEAMRKWREGWAKLA